MRQGGIVAAAIDVLSEIAERHRPANLALRDWGTAHRFAGSGDRNALGNLVFDALRHRSSIAWHMGSDAPRALAIGAYALAWGHDVAALDALFADDRHAPEALTEDERQRLAHGAEAAPPDHVAGDFPEWLDGELRDAFGPDLVAETAALAGRAPVDLRVNTLKAGRDKVLGALARFSAAPTELSPVGIRLPAGSGPARAPHVQAELGYKKGWFEVQDEGSQLAALLAAGQAGEQVADVCAGGGGKTLALAAAMEGKGQVHAFDADPRRLGDIHERVQRAAARNVQLVGSGDPGVLAPLEGRMNLVLVDAPCTGSGTWRRRPDAKWRVSANALADRRREQQEALDLAAPLVAPGGRLAYVTCSVLPSENDGAVADFLERTPGFAARPGESVAEAVPGLSARARPTRHGLQLTPARTGTDGFYVAILDRR